MFGPVVLIALGVLFLLLNLGFLPGLDWSVALRLWPLLLVFGGLNIIVRQAPRPIGTFLSLLVGLAAVAFFGFILLRGGSLPLFNRLAAQNELQRERVFLPLEGVDAASVAIELNEAGGQLYALEDSAQLVDADVTFRDRLEFETSVEDGQATVSLRSAFGAGPIFWLDPANWVNWAGNQWQIGLSPTVPVELNLELGSGRVSGALDELRLNSLIVDAGSGPAELALPDGEYDVQLNAGSGPLTVILPAAGHHQIVVDGGSGPLTLRVPESIAARLAAEDGSGPLRVSIARLEQMSGDNEEGVWQTPDYFGADDRLEIQVEVGSGPVTVEER
jgi:hypothetical protein